MKIIVNGKETPLKGSMNIQEFLNENGYEGKVVAVAVNGSFVPKSQHKNTLINSGDEVEIVAPMQGG